VLNLVVFALDLLFLLTIIMYLECHWNNDDFFFQIIVFIYLFVHVLDKHMSTWLHKRECNRDRQRCGHSIGRRGPFNTPITLKEKSMR